MVARRMSLFGVAIDAALFLLKLVAGLAANSAALVADAVSSLLSTLYHLGIVWSVDKSHEKAGRGIPFAHGRAEPMVVFVIALLTGIAGFEFLRLGVFGLVIGGSQVHLTWLVVSALVISILGKVLLSHETEAAGVRSRSVPLISAAAEYRDDIIVTLIALAGMVFAATGFPRADAIATLLISCYLFWEAYRIGKENLRYLNGEQPSRDLERSVRVAVTGVRGVRGISRLLAHRLGNFQQVEIHLRVGDTISMQAAHHIAMTVQHDVERIAGVSQAFVAFD